MNPPQHDIETVRRFWQNRPCNIRHSDLPFGTREFFDAVESRKYFVEPHIPGFAEFDRWRGKKVLEIGCGIGTDAVNFARAGADYYGIELSKVSLDVTAQRFAVFGLRGKFFLGNAEQVDRIVPKQKYDLIYSFGVIHHTPSPGAVLAAARNLVGPESELRIMVYAANSWKSIMIGAGLDQPEAQHGCPIAYTYTKQELIYLLANAGFSTQSIDQAHIFPYVVEKYVKYEYEKTPWFAAMPPEMFAALEAKLGWHLLVKARPMF